MDELDFTIEFNSNLSDPDLESNLMSEADSRLRQLAAGNDDITGAAVTLRQPAKRETPPLHEATVIVRVRPDNVVGTEKQDTPIGALKGALDAVEKQVRKKREKLRDRWEQPQSDPVTKEVMEVTAAEEGLEDIEDIDDIVEGDSGAEGQG